MTLITKLSLIFIRFFIHVLKLLILTIFTRKKNRVLCNLFGNVFFCCFELWILFVTHKILKIHDD